VGTAPFDVHLAASIALTAAAVFSIIKPVPQPG
jgi:hypothetical protein